MPYLTNEERETIICFNEQESTARVFTYNRKMSNYLREQASDPQTSCRLLEDNLNVLIYPYWNVNTCLSIWQSQSTNGFNLSILECKLKEDSENGDDLMVF